MPTLAQRRNRNVAITAAVIVALGVLDWIYRASLHSPKTLDGWLLLVLVLVLTFFNLRKKIPVLPLLSAATWLEVHAYLGLVAIAAFALHGGIAPPPGDFETALWVVFILVTISGLFGLWLSRAAPARIRQRGEAVLFDRIPIFRAQLADDVAALAKRSVNETASTVIADLYADRLAAYFAKPRNLFDHLIGSQRSLYELRREIIDRLRYLGPEGRAILATIEARVATKDDLDHQHALYIALRAWLFVHVPLTYAMLLLIACHLILVFGIGRF